MDFAQVVKNRHSVRKYTDEAVDRELIDAILDMALTAPSSKNTKSSSFMVVEDRDTLAAISEMRSSGSTFVKDAPAAIIVLGDPEKTDLWEVNAAISSTFVQLAATSLGLGSCWVQVAGRPRDKHDESKGLAEDYLKELLGIRSQYHVLCVIALGYEAE